MTVPIPIPTPPPNGLTARPLSMDDVASVTDLLAAWERAEPVDQSYSETDIGEELAAPDAVLDGGGLRGPAPAEAADPTGVRIRPYAVADDEALRLVSNASFADHWGSAPRDPDSWRSEHSAAAAFRPAASFVAEQAGGSIVGFVLAAEHDADTARRGYRTGCVARVGTAREARGRGIGTALVSRSMAAMQMQGCAAAELHVDAASPTGAGRLYTRLGFGVVDRDRLLTRRL